MPKTALPAATARPQSGFSAVMPAPHEKHLGVNEFLRLLHFEFGVARRRALAARKERRRRIGGREFAGQVREGMLSPLSPAQGAEPAQHEEWRISAHPVEEFPSLQLLAAVSDPFSRDSASLPAGAGGTIFDAAVRGTRPREAALHSTEDSGAEAPRPISAKKRPTVFLRPRGLEADTDELLFDGRASSAALFDLGLHCFEKAPAALSHGEKICFSLPGIESREEAQFWREVLRFAERRLQLPRESIRVILPIETVAAAIDMDAVLFDLREFAIALACSPALYLANFAATFRKNRELVLPDRSSITMEQPFLRAYQDLLVHTSHRHGALAFCTGPAQLELRGHREVENGNAWKEEEMLAHIGKEFALGFDGVILADAKFLAAALRAFPSRHGKRIRQGEVGVCFLSPRDLFSRPFGPMTLEALREDIALALEAIESFLSGAAGVRGPSVNWPAAELCRAQISQWLLHSVPLTPGHRLDRRTLGAIIRDYAVAADSWRRASGSASKLSAAANLLLAACDQDADTPLTTLLASYPGAA